MATIKMTIDEEDAKVYSFIGNSSNIQIIKAVIEDQQKIYGSTSRQELRNMMEKSGYLDYLAKVLSESTALNTACECLTFKE